MSLSKKIIAQLLPTNPIVVEAGAHRGRDTRHMSKLWPEGTIYAFEPVIELYQELIRHVDTNVKCYPYALSSSTGSATIHVSSNSDAASSLLRPLEYCVEHPLVNFEPRTIQAITLDDWAHKNSIERVDFLWLDMQGFEYHMLAASRIILPTVKVIHTEINTKQRYAGHPLYPEYKLWLESHNFKLVYDFIGIYGWGDALFVRTL